MAFEITKTFVVKAPSSHVWEFLIDPRRVATCLPGASIGDKIDDKTYTGALLAPGTIFWNNNTLWTKI